MKKIMSLVLVLMLCALMAAPVMAEEANYNISVILKTTASEYWGYVVAGAEAYMADHPNVKVEVKGASSETAYDEQQNMIETDMANGDIDGYVIAPLQADMVANMIAGQTKPIVAVDTNIEAPEVLSFVGTGNEAAGKLGGAAAAKLAKERGWEEIKCIEIAGVQGDSTNEARMNGYKAGVEEEGDRHHLRQQRRYGHCRRSCRCRQRGLCQYCVPGLRWHPVRLQLHPGR